MPPRRINPVAHGKRVIGADAALRLSRYFGRSCEYRLHLQSLHGQRVAQEQLREAPDSGEPLAT